MDLGDLAPVLVIFCVLAAAAWIVWIVSGNIRRRKIAEMQTSMHTRLLEKFGSSPELLEYLRSEAGQRFVDSATIERSNPMGRIMGSVQAGLILLLVGNAMLGVGSRFPAQAKDLLILLGAMGAAAGAGFLLSAGISYWLTRSWGLLERKGSSPH